MQELISKADVLLEALPYIQRFRNETFVVKYGGSFMDSPDPAVHQSVARDVVFLEATGINPVVVHGGGRAITRALKASGREATFIQGMRVTDAQSMAIVEAVLSGEINSEIVDLIRALGGRAQGFAGSSILRSRKLQMTGRDEQEIDLGLVGEVCGVDAAPLQ